MITNMICPICKNMGASLYEKLSDHTFGTEGIWDLNICIHCHHVWLRTIPNRTHIMPLYKDYYTHVLTKSGVSSYLLNELEDHIYCNHYGYTSVYSYYKHHRIIRYLATIEILREVIEYKIMKIPRSWGTRLLDIGCGNGVFISKMQSLGWYVEGTDIDLASIEYARNIFKLNVHYGEIHDLSIRSNSFDIITLNHVIEHIDNPSVLLSECYRILKPGGKLVLLTPNIESLGSKIFKQYWRGLEIPRHFNLFTMDTLIKTCILTGFRTHSVTTTARMARHLYRESLKIYVKSKRSSNMITIEPIEKLSSYLFQIFEWVINKVKRSMGEEIFYIGTK